MNRIDVLGREWTPEDDRQRHLVMQALSDRFEHRSIGLAEQEMTRSLADGFGPIDPSSDDYRQMLWDWSHVRDSSPAGVRRMFDYLAALGVIA